MPQEVIELKMTSGGFDLTDSDMNSMESISEVAYRKGMMYHLKKLTKPKKEYSIVTKCVAEFLGDFTFVFIGTLQAYVHEGTADNILHAAFAHGITLFIMVSIIGHISGAHINPAVSWALVLAGKLPPLHFPLYTFSQLLGGFCGSLVSANLMRHTIIRTFQVINERDVHAYNPNMLLYEYQPVVNATTIKAIMTKGQLEVTKAGATLLNPDNQWWEGLLSEAVATYFLCHTILMCAADTDQYVLAPLAIGLTLTIDILATGVITGASMNPARSLGPNLVGWMLIPHSKLPAGFWGYHYIYWGGPFAGATIAVFIYRIFESRELRLIP